MVDGGLFRLSQESVGMDGANGAIVPWLAIRRVGFSVSEAYTCESVKPLTACHRHIGIEQCSSIAICSVPFESVDRWRIAVPGVAVEVLRPCIGIRTICPRAIAKLGAGGDLSAAVPLKSIRTFQVDDIAVTK